MFKSTESKFNVAGFVRAGFEPVRDAFEAIFAEGAGEAGAGFTAYYKGDKVVELVGGYTDPSHSAPFIADNVHIVHSCGKALMSMSVCHAISRGFLNWDTKVADVWPEFGAGGKENVTVKDLLEHQGGVAWLDAPFLPNVADLADLDALAKRIAGQPHNYGSKTTKCYHAVTRGWYLNELLRRTMNTTQGDLMRDWSDKLGVSVFVGLPESAESRVVDVTWSQLSKRMIELSKTVPHTANFKALIGTKIADVDPPEENVLQSNVRSVQRGQTPSAFTLTNASGLAAFANVMAMGGSWGGVDLLDPKTFAEAHTLEPVNLDVPDTFSNALVRTVYGGWALSTPGTIVPYMRADFATMPPTFFVPDEYKGEGWEWCGWYGLGGSCIQWEPKRQVAISFAPTLLGFGSGRADERGARCALAFVKCVEALEGKGA